MTKEEAIEYLHRLYMKAEITDAYGDMDDTEPYEEAIDMAVEALNVQRWIPVNERLPETNGEYLVTVNTDDGLEVYQDMFWAWGCLWDDWGKAVIAWMELPEPYKEADHD